MPSPPVEGGDGPGHEPAPFRAPMLRGRRAELRTIGPADYAFLQQMELGSDLLLRWRLRGTTPSPEQWAQTLWAGVLAQFMVISVATGRPAGHVAAYRTNFQDRYSYLSVAGFGGSARSPAVMVGLALFIDYVFTCWDLRKLYLETPDFNYDQFASGAGRFFEVEGRLREHFFYDGRYRDQLTLGMRRDAWLEHRDSVLALERPTGERRVTIRMPELEPRG